MKIRCLIIDDEPIARDLLKLYCEQAPGLELITTCINAEEAYRALHEHEIDLIFLDIEMPGIRGTDFLRSLKKPPLVVFTTAYSHYAVEGFELNSVDYLVKPITFERFYQAVQKVADRLGSNINNHDEKPDHVFLKQDSKLIRVVFSQINYIQAERDFSSVFLEDKRLLAGMHLKLMEAILPARIFLRVHRSFIVNLNRISEIKGNTLIINGHEIPVGAGYRDELFRRLGI
jgi:DNA-binding LytR/AlgR family response regulator